MSTTKSPTWREFREWTTLGWKEAHHELLEKTVLRQRMADGFTQRTGNGELDRKLIEAISERKVADVKALLDAGANPNAGSRRSSYRPGSAAAIHFAPVGQYAKDEEDELSWQIIDLLLKSGANIDAPGSDGYGDKQ